MRILITVSVSDEITSVLESGKGFLVEKRVGALLAIEYSRRFDTLEQALDQLHLQHDDYVPYVTKDKRK